MAARALSVSFSALLTSFGLGWHLDEITEEFGLKREQVKKLTDTLKKTTGNEVLAVALTLGPTKFVDGPLALMVDLVTAGGVLEFYTYLVLAQGNLSEQPDRSRRSALYAERAEIHRSPIQNESFSTALALFLIGLCIRLIRWGRSVPALGQFKGSTATRECWISDAAVTGRPNAGRG